MREDRSLGRPAQLKQIRLMSCLPNQVLLAYPALTELISQNKITLDIAPEQVISSFLQDQQVTTLDQVWLAESAQSEEEKKSRPEWFYSYIDLNTIAVYRFGEGTALQGQYQVHVNGIALGIGSKWSMVFIRYDSLSGMAVGETRQIIYPEIDISAALWLNLQIDLLPVLTVQLPSEINSWGLSIGLASDIAVTKMY